jgi:hypothetical protein
MALDTFIAGRYTGTYDAVDVGIQENGYELQQEPKARTINQSDAYGETTIDTIYSGADYFLQFMGLAYKAGSIAPFWPWAALGTMGIISRLGSDTAEAMVLTAIAGTPAATAPASLTATKAILAPNYSASLLFTSELRKVPVRLQFLPSDVGAGVIKWFATA